MDVEIRHIDGYKGKGLFAKKNFKAGSVIFEETPIVCVQFSWNAAYGYKACDNCLKPLETAEENARRLTAKPEILLPHPECCTTNKNTVVACNMCGIEYCSPECQSKAFNEYHQVLCKQIAHHDPGHPLNELEEAWKTTHYPPEVSSIMLIPRILARILQSPNREAAMAQILSFCHRSVNEDAEIAHKCLGQKFTDQMATFHSLLVKALPNEGIEQFLTTNGFQSLIALIGTNGQGVGTSPISQWVTKSSELPLPDDDKQALDDFIDKLYEDLDAHSGNFLNNEGIALYGLQSACNHSCLANAEPTFLRNSSTLSLVALSDIEAGEEISISYLDECSLQRSRHSRQKHLKENYLFLCKCVKCLSQAGDADVTSEEEEEEEMSE